MRNLQIRKSPRTQVTMTLRSAQLPSFSAKVVDLSLGGAKIKLKGKPQESLVEERIRVTASLPTQQGQAFTGYARVAWVKEIDGRFEAGLQWEKFTDLAIDSVKATLIKTAA